MPFLTFTLLKSRFRSRSEEEISTKPPVSRLLSRDTFAIELLGFAESTPFAFIIPLKSVISSDQTTTVPPLPSELETFMVEFVPTIVCFAFFILF